MIKSNAKRTLFSFHVREGEEMASDSDDSDYMPSDEEAAAIGITVPSKEKKSKKCRLASKKSSSKDQKRKRGAMKVSFGPTDSEQPKPDTRGVRPGEHCYDDAWGSKLPLEILIKIFQYVVDSDGSLPFLCRAARVNNLWADAANHYPLWKKVDLSYGWIKTKEETLKWLCNNRLQRTEQLSLSSWKKLVNSGLELITKNCRCLKSINLSYCSKVNSCGMKLLLDAYMLESLDISYMSPDAVSPPILKYLVDERSSHLKQLHMAGNTLKGFGGIMTSIYSHCEKLEVLDISNCTTTAECISLNIEKLQQGCPNLTALRLANTKVRVPQASRKVQDSAPGFARLHEVSLAVSCGDGLSTAGLDNNSIYRLLKASYDLRLLDLRGCTSVSSDVLVTLPVTDLQHLFISKSSVAKNSETALESIFAKWGHSLLEFDGSWNLYPGQSFDLAIDKLCQCPTTPKLEKLDLSGTSILYSNVKCVLRGCPSLRVLNLTSCRVLPRGMKTLYTDKMLDKLRKNIGTFDDAEEKSAPKVNRKKKKCINYSDSE